MSLLRNLLLPATSVFKKLIKNDVLLSFNTRGDNNSCFPHWLDFSKCLFNTNPPKHCPLTLLPKWTNKWSDFAKTIFLVPSQIEITTIVTAVTRAATIREATAARACSTEMATEMSARPSAAAVGNPTATTSEGETKIERAADASSGHVRSETLLPSAKSASTAMSTASEKRITPREGTRIAALAASATEVLLKFNFIQANLFISGSFQKYDARSSRDEHTSNHNRPHFADREHRSYGGQSYRREFRGEHCTRSGRGAFSQTSTDNHRRRRDRDSERNSDER